MKGYSPVSDGIVNKILMNLIVIWAGTVVYVNLIMALIVPEHWCRIPGREETNYTLEEWKWIHIPREIDFHGNEVYSSCFMYGSDHSEKIQCYNGYEYSEKWFKNTLISSENWVCENGLNAANLVAACKIGEIVGGLIFAYIENRISRKPIILICLTVMTLARLISPFVAKWYSLFVSLCILSSFHASIIGQSTIIALKENSSQNDKTSVIMAQNLGWSLGNCLLPLMYWLSNDWINYILLTTTPLWSFLLITLFVVEPPDCVLSKKSLGEFFDQLKFSSDDNVVLSTFENGFVPAKKSSGVSSLFKTTASTKLTILYILEWITTIVCYTALFFGSITLPGNPLINFLIQTLADVPSYICAPRMCKTIGKKLTSFFGFFVATLSFLILICTVNDSDLSHWQITMAAMARFGLSTCYFIINQQRSLFATDTRNSVHLLSFAIGNGFAIFSPYIVYLERTYDARFSYVILMLLTMIGGLSAMFLPETSNCLQSQVIFDAKKSERKQSVKFSGKIPSEPDDVMINFNEIEMVNA